MAEKGPVTVAAAAMRVVHDKGRNLKRYLEFLEEAAEKGARLVVFPEQSLQGYLYSLDHQFTPEELEYHHRNAEPVPGESTQLLTEQAREKGMYIVFGMTEVGPANHVPTLFNSAVMVGPEGLAAVYRKVHLPGDERNIFRPGRSWEVVSTPLGRVGLLICWDQAFPESTRELTLAGAQILVMPTARGKTTSYFYDLFSRTRALENRRWFIASNQVGLCDQGETDYYGHSLIVDPRGHIVAETGDEAEGLAVATIAVAEEIEKEAQSLFYLPRWRVPGMYRRIGEEG
ncbi:MAG: carbon-nitrogen hydrolase family protein [Chloroflexi bacterium]|nr:carbon-nitrogen hydrolase family protein [Chloroflexota bacterium]